MNNRTIKGVVFPYQQRIQEKNEHFWEVFNPINNALLSRDEVYWGEKKIINFYDISILAVLNASLLSNHQLDKCEKYRNHLDIAYPQDDKQP